METTSMNTAVKLVECPRDAMQGMKEFVPTAEKIAYINSILKCNFNTVDFGSFVSPKAIPQMADTAEVLAGLDLSGPSKLLAIIANVRGAEDACRFNEIKYLGFPFSISETFQQRNTNSSIAESLDRVKEIQNLCLKTNKELVVYISMAFGNPYGDTWNAEIAMEWCEKLYRELGVKILALSDTIGVSDPQNIDYLFRSLIPALPEVEFGAHLHTTPDTWEEKVAAAYQAGCRRFDGAIKGFGGCPMAKDDLTGNMPTEKMIGYFNVHHISTGINNDHFNQTLIDSSRIFH